MNGRIGALCAAVVVSAAGVCGGGPTAGAPATPADMDALGRAILGRVGPALVRVEYTLQTDKGEEPGMRGYGGGRMSGSLAEERPVEAAGLLLSPTRVVTPMPGLHPRFVKEVAVRVGGRVIPAEPWAYGRTQDAVILALSKPAEGVRPADFDAKAAGPFYAVMSFLAGGGWQTTVTPMPAALTVRESGERFVAAPEHCLVVAASGLAVGVSTTGELPVDGSWKGSPLDWDLVQADEVARLLADLEARAGKCLLRVALSFRSPPKRAGRGMYDPDDYGEDGSTTEKNVVGVLVDDRTVLVLASLPPKTTARLERIAAHPKAGPPAPAKFHATLKDYGAFVATLEKPLSAPAVLADGKCLALRHRLLLSAEVVVQGEGRVDHYWLRRVESFSVGWRRQIYPDVCGPYGPDGGRSLFLFDAAGRLAVLPVARRERVTTEDRWYPREGLSTFAGYLRAVLADLPAHADKTNVPLTPAEESRLAWLGVELQALNRDLARVNKVAHLTRDGQTGTIVSYVYPGSPADQAGIKPGQVLLRLHVKGHPKPLEVRLESYGYEGMDFPWEHLDRMDERYFERLPTPWPPAENTFTRALTDLGIGKGFTAELAQDGKTFTKDFQVVLGPPHYDSAPRYKDEALGITVRDLTYEVRRYFRKKPDEPGVIISKVEPGSKASVAKLRPFEIITQVNDQPIRSAQDLAKAVKGQSELRLAVKRMTKGRVVRIDMTAPAPKPPDRPAPPRGPIRPEPE